jgi:pilus assembly protein Flp/PilA
MSTLVSMLKDQSGATAAEYGLIIAIVGSSVALAAISLGTTIADTMNSVAGVIHNCVGEPSC